MTDEQKKLEIEFVRRLKALNAFDNEVAHSDADKILLEALRAFGHGAIADAYEDVESEVVFHRA